MGAPMAYFITFTCYGTWLHGDERGSVDQEHNAPERRCCRPTQTATPGDGKPSPSRPITSMATTPSHAGCGMRDRPAEGWTLDAVHVRSNHVHIVVTAPGPPERVMNDFKTAASRRLNKAFPGERDRTRGRATAARATCGPRKPSRKRCITCGRQGEPMERYPGRAAHAAQRSKRAWCRLDLRLGPRSLSAICNPPWRPRGSVLPPPLTRRGQGLAGEGDPGSVEGAPVWWCRHLEWELLHSEAEELLKGEAVPKK